MPHRAHTSRSGPSVSGDILHELRTRISHIVGSADYLLDEADPPLDPPLQAAAAEVRAEGFKLLDTFSVLAGLAHKRADISGIAIAIRSVVDRIEVLGRELAPLALNDQDVARIVAAAPRLRGPSAALVELVRADPGAIESMVSDTSDVETQRDWSDVGLDHRARVLVVDDDDASRAFLRRGLARFACDVLEAATGAAGLALFQRENIDLVLLDVRIPQLDGIQVCLRIREQARDVPIIVLTASDEADKVLALDAGANEFLCKPFDQAELLARVHSLLRLRGFHQKVQAFAAEQASRAEQLDRDLHEKEMKIHALERLQDFLPPGVAQLVAEDPERLKSHRSDVTVLVCDLAGFADYAVTAQPENVMDVLGEYYAVAGDIIFAQGGTLERFDVDRLSVLFNDPVESTDPMGEALTTALLLRDGLVKLSRDWRKRHIRVHFRAGIDHGFATLGPIGVKHLEYAAIGPVTHVAARLCDLAGPDQILVSQDIKVETDRRFDFSAAGSTAIKGDDVDLFSLDRAHSAKGAESILSELTPRQREVAVLLAHGVPRKVIAHKLSVGTRTVDKHLQEIYRHPGLESRGELMARVLAEEAAAQPAN
jgi:DNA-binding NarL/FixJ family response regulator